MYKIVKYNNKFKNYRIKTHGVGKFFKHFFLNISVKKITKLNMTESRKKSTHK